MNCLALRMYQISGIIRIPTKCTVTYNKPSLASSRVMNVYMMKIIHKRIDSEQNFNTS